MNYAPPLHYRRLTVFYDIFMRLTMRDVAIKSKLVEDSLIENGFRVLDLGCATGTLLLMIKRKYPDSDVIGLDIDGDALGLAVHKAYKTRVPISLVKGTAFQLPFPTATFDRVVSSLVSHHLVKEQKIPAMREVFRVLKPGGLFLLADFGKPHHFLMSIMAHIVENLENTSDNIQGLLPDIMKKSGFSDATQIRRFSTTFGTLAFYIGTKPG